MLFFLAQGYRVIAHDRRGHGRSTETDTGNEMDTYAALLSIKLLKHGTLKTYPGLPHGMCTTPSGDHQPGPAGLHQELGL